MKQKFRSKCRKFNLYTSTYKKNSKYSNCILFETKYLLFDAFFSIKSKRVIYLIWYIHLITVIINIKIYIAFSLFSLFVWMILSLYTCATYSITTLEISCVSTFILSLTPRLVNNILKNYFSSFLIFIFLKLFHVDNFSHCRLNPLNHVS